MIDTIKNVDVKNIILLKPRGPLLPPLPLEKKMLKTLQAPPPSPTDYIEKIS
jgi:hypothetical protein